MVILLNIKTKGSRHHIAKAFDLDMTGGYILICGFLTNHENQSGNR